MNYFKGMLASLIFFTRLPLGRIAGKIPLEYYNRIVPFWPFVGWITAIVRAAVYICCCCVMEPYAAAVIAFMSRTLLTGALHEDGLADFFDAFGVRHSKERTLEIMKDSHIGTFGVISLILYYGSGVGLIASVAPVIGAAILFSADAWSKFLAGRIISLLPYARKAEDAKNKAVYSRENPSAFIFSLLLGMAPMAVVVILWHMFALPLSVSVVASVAAFLLLTSFIRKRIGGYTGDCCGALDLILEFIFMLAAVVVINLLYVVLPSAMLLP